MANFEIKIRNLESNETLIAQLDTFEDAVTFLKERPRLVEVLSVLSTVSVSEREQLKGSMRPYDDEEKRVLAEREAQTKEAIRQQIEQEKRDATLAERQAREEARTADPNRPMNIHWDAEDGISISDPYDDRPLSDTVKDAVIAWVQERNSWVADRGQMVAFADLVVWPGPIPSDQEPNRVLRGGTFTPCLRPD